MRGALAPHLCEACKEPQPLQPEEDYFRALGAPKRFAQDQSALQARFYELSRALHPDRFSSGSSADAQRNSIERMSFLNQAYSTLKSQDLLRAYLLKMEGVESPIPERAGSQIPLDLAEAWFDLQDVLAEDPQAASPKAKEFEVLLTRRIQENEALIQKLERDYDRAPLPSLLQEMARELHTRSYLESLQKDVARIQTHGGKSQQ